MSERLGYIGYRLYSTGWKNGLHPHSTTIQHWLLSIFLLYRQGYAESLKWVKEYQVEKIAK